MNKQMERVIQKLSCKLFEIFEGFRKLLNISEG